MQYLCENPPIVTHLLRLVHHHSVTLEKILQNQILLEVVPSKLTPLSALLDMLLLLLPLIVLLLARPILSLDRSIAVLSRLHHCHLYLLVVICPDALGHTEGKRVHIDYQERMRPMTIILQFGQGRNTVSTVGGEC
jgi:hypothetical protein